MKREPRMSYADKEGTLSLAGFCSLIYSIVGIPILLTEVGWSLLWFLPYVLFFSPYTVLVTSHRVKLWYWDNHTEQGRMNRAEREAWQRLEKAQKWADHQKQLAIIEKRIDKTLNLEDL